MIAAAVIAIRLGEDSKARLKAALDRSRRRALVFAMFEDMARAILGISPHVRTVVVTPNAEIAVRAIELGVEPLIQPSGQGLNEAFVQALTHIRADLPEAGIALLPGDLPLLQAPDLEALGRALRTAAAAISPAFGDGGTGALALSPRSKLTPSFGPDSFQRHLRLLRRLGEPFEVVRRPGLGLDLDRPEDIAPILERDCGPRTAAILRQSRLTPHPANGRELGPNGLPPLR